MFEYILHNDFVEELSARQNYLLRTFHLYFLVTARTPRCIKLRSFPFSETRFVIIFGHCNWVFDYLRDHNTELRRKVKIIHSCYPKEIVSRLEQGNVYFCKVTPSGEALRYDGRQYGLTFDVTNSELDALNAAHLPLWEQIRFAYERVA